MALGAVVNRLTIAKRLRDLTLELDELTALAAAALVEAGWHPEDADGAAQQAFYGPESEILALVAALEDPEDGAALDPEDTTVTGSGIDRDSGDLG